jgi:hypothetical protein
MVKLEIVLCPDEAELVFRALDCAREVEHEVCDKDDDDASAETPKETVGGWPSRADGVVALAEGFLAGHAATGNGGERFQVTLHVDQDPLAADGVLAATLEDGTHVSAGVVAVGGDGERMSVGRRTRTIPPAIRRALQLRDRGCRFPGCTHQRFLHGHMSNTGCTGARLGWTICCCSALAIIIWYTRTAGRSSGRLAGNGRS